MTGRQTPDRPGGMPAFEPTQEQRTLVESLVAYGIPYLEICRLVINPRTKRPINTETLMKHFRDELDVGATKANAKVAESLYRQAIDGNITAAIWWTKCRMAWKETVRSEHTGADGGPVRSEQKLDLTKLSEEQLTTFVEILTAAQPTAAQIEAISDGTKH